MQEIIVAIIVLAACGFTLKRYLPRAFRLAMAQRLAAQCTRWGWHRLARRLAMVSKVDAGACSSCDACKKAPSKQTGFALSALKDTLRRR